MKEPDFWKQVPTGQEGSKMRFSKFWQKSNPFMFFFYLNVKEPRVFSYHSFDLINTLVLVFVRDALCDLVPFVQFKKRENTHRGVLLLVASNFTKSNTLPCMLFTFYKLYKWYQIAQSITFIYQFSNTRGIKDGM